MASLMNVESFFSALTGGEELEIDFPSDRLFRKIGVYLRLLFAAILIGTSFTTPNACYLPGRLGYGAATEKTEELTANYINHFCFSTNKFLPLQNDSYNENSKENKTEPDVYFFSFLPYTLIFEAFLSYIPYLLYVTKTKSIIHPILNEAMDMAILTSGTFEERKSKEKTDGDDEYDTDKSDDEENYAKSIQKSIKKRLYAKMALFVSHRLKAIEGFELVDHYHLCHVVVKVLIVVVQSAIIALLFIFSFPFPLQLVCPLSQNLQNLVSTSAVSCIFPYNKMSFVFLTFDVFITISLPFVSFLLYVGYWKKGFYSDLKKARRLVPKKGRYQFNEFIKHMFTATLINESKDEDKGEGKGESLDLQYGEKLVSRQVDDVRLTLALLHANVDKFIANKIMTVYAGRVDLEQSDQLMKGGPKEKGCGKGAFRRVLRFLRPTLPKSKWEKQS